MRLYSIARLLRPLIRVPYLRIQNRSIEYRELAATRPRAPTLVLLHEGLGSIAQWREFPDQLAQATGCRTLVYSRYGYGGSEVLAAPQPLDFMHREANESLPELLRQLAIENPVLIGHSDGASIALIHAGAGFPVRGLILEAPHVFVEEETLAGIRAAKQAFLETDLPRRLAKFHRDAGKTFGGWCDVWLDPAFRSWDIRAGLTRIEAPVLLVQGEQDEYGTMAQVEAIAGQVRGPVGVLKLSACGHSPHRDQPQAVLQAMVAFVDRLS